MESHLDSLSLGGNTRMSTSTLMGTRGALAVIISPWDTSVRKERCPCLLLKSKQEWSLTGV